MTLLKKLEKGAPLEKASKAAIFLHGRGGTAESMLGLAERICGDAFYIMAPQATNHTWYPYSFLEEEEKNEPCLSESLKSIKDLIDQIKEQIPLERLYLIGFSQGACLALEVSCRFADKYGGIIAFTGGLIGKNIDEKKYQGNFAGTEVFLSNSENDPHVPLIRSRQSKELMEKLGAHTTLQVYPGRPHTISGEEISFAKRLLNA